GRLRTVPGDGVWSPSNVHSKKGLIFHRWHSGTWSRRVLARLQGFCAGLRRNVPLGRTSGTMGFKPAPLSQARLPAVGEGRQADMGFESTAEVALIGKANTQGNLRERGVCRSQLPAGIVDT